MFLNHACARINVVENANHRIVLNIFGNHFERVSMNFVADITENGVAAPIAFGVTLRHGSVYMLLPQPGYSPGVVLALPSRETHSGEEWAAARSASAP